MSNIFVVVEERPTTVVVEDPGESVVVVQSGYAPRVVEVGVPGLQGPPGTGGGASVHDFLGALHELDGLTAGHVLRATSATTADFEDLGDAYEATGTAAMLLELHEAAANPHTGYALLGAANTFTVGPQAIIGSSDVEQFTVTAHSAQTNAIVGIRHNNGDIALGLYSIGGFTFANFLGTTGQTAVNGFTFSNNNAGSLFGAVKARGTQSAPLDVVSADEILRLQAQGYWSGTYRSAAHIGMIVDGSPSGTRVPGRIGFFTGTTTGNPTERMRLDSVGDMYRLGASASAFAMRTRTAIGNANDNWHVRIDGLMEWGAGGASAVDVNQYRFAAGVLKTDHQFRAVDGLQTKRVSGAGRTAAADGDFAVTPVDGTLAVVRDTTTGKRYLSLRDNGSWASVEAT